MALLVRYEAQVFLLYLISADLRHGEVKAAGMDLPPPPHSRTCAALHTLPPPNRLSSFPLSPCLSPPHSTAVHRQWGPGEYRLVLNYSNQQWQQAGEHGKEVRR